MDFSNRIAPKAALLGLRPRSHLNRRSFVPHDS